MSETKDFGSFINENRKLAKEYLDTKMEIYRLQAISIFSRSSGYFLWIIISLALISLLFVFLGLVCGFWLSQIMGSYTKGFGITTLLILGLIICLAIFRRALFINPVIRTILKHAEKENTTVENEVNETDVK